MNQVRAIEIFLEVVERGSMSGAAKGLGMSRAMVSRYIDSLEHWIGVKLLFRSTRHTALTGAGEDVLPRLRQLVTLSDEVRSIAGARHTEPAGKLRVSTCLSFAQTHLTRLLCNFLTQYPRTRIELLTFDRNLNLEEDRIDLAIRVTRQVQDSYVTKVLAPCRSVLCASPSYLQRHGTPNTPSELRRHLCVTHEYGMRTFFRLTRNGETVTVPVSGSFHSNETCVIRDGVLGGCGIGMLPTYYVHDLIAQGQLVRVLPDYDPDRMEIFAIYRPSKHQNIVLRILLEFLEERLKSDEGLAVAI